MPLPSPTTYPSATTYPGVPGAGWVTVRREQAPPIQITAVSPSGLRYRWADDEPESEHVPSGLRYSSSMPGGSDTLNVTLPRDPERSYPDLGLLTELQVSRAAGRTQTFRLEETPRASGDQMAVEPAARGYRSVLEDRADVRVLYIDRDLSRWGPMGRTRRIALLPTESVGDPSTYVDPTSGYPALALETDGEWGASFPPWCEAWYDAGEGLKVGGVYTQTTVVNCGSSDWGNELWGTNYDDNTGGALIKSIGYSSTTVDETLTTPTRFVFFYFFWSLASANSEPGKIYGEHYKRVRVVGNHGLTLSGSGDTSGLYTGEMLEHLIQTHTLLEAGTIEDGTFLQTHAVFRDGSTALSIVENLSRYEPLFDWMVWDQEFSFRRRGTYGKKWRARVGPSGLRSAGQDISRVWNQIAVKVSDPLYGDLIVGPTGSGYTNTSADLLTDDPDNAANQAGATRREVLDIGEGTLEGAIEVGKRFLVEANRLDQSGQCELTGFVEDEAGIAWPVDEVRAGDEISFTDSSDTSYRRISATSYAHDSRTNSLTIDSPAPTMDALLARLGAVLLPLN